jgi:hypothetical protein
MTLDEFWEHIHKSKRKDSAAHVKRLIARLAKLKPDEVLDFDHWWHLMMGEAYNWNLWGAAYLINGGCSDDGFEYFRDWLILQGRDTFQAALTNPDTLADVTDPARDDYECECYPGTDAWFAAVGADPDDDGYAAFHAAREARHPGRSTRLAPFEDGQELGEGWDFDDADEMKKRYPKLFKRHGWMEGS